MDTDSKANDDIDDIMPHEENIRVVCRFRPVRPQELHEEKNQQSGKVPMKLNIDGNANTVKIKSTTKSARVKDFNIRLDDILTDQTTQEEAFATLGKPLVENVVKGYNCTIFAYGQTGSGKTYSMFGNENYNSNHGELGLIPRSLFYLYELLNNDDECLRYEVKISVLEIYKERLRDLIDLSEKRLVIYTIGKLEIKNLFAKKCTTHTAAIKCIVTALLNRQTRTTGFINHESSRSHCVVIVSVQQFLQSGTSKFSKLHFGDLAGSEKQRRTGSRKSGTSEAGAIHKGLLALQKVINALTSTSGGGGQRHIPYRDSPLTKILEGSLGGNSKTTLLVTCTPHLSSIGETKSTLMFAKNCKKITNRVEINKVKTVEELSLEILKLRAKISVLSLENKQLKSQMGLDSGQQQQNGNHNNNTNNNSKKNAKQKSKSKKKRQSNELETSSVEVEDSLLLTRLREKEEELLQIQQLMDTFKNDNLKKQERIESLHPQLEDKERQINEYHAQNREFQSQIQGKDVVISEKDEIIRQLRLQLKQQQQQLQQQSASQQQQQQQQQSQHRPSVPTPTDNTANSDAHPHPHAHAHAHSAARLSVMDRIGMYNSKSTHSRNSSSDSDNGNIPSVHNLRIQTAANSGTGRRKSWLEEAKDEADTNETAYNVTQYLRQSFSQMSFKPASHSNIGHMVHSHKVYPAGSKYNRDGSMNPAVSVVNTTKSNSNRNKKVQPSTSTATTASAGTLKPDYDDTVREVSASPTPPQQRPPPIPTDAMPKPPKVQNEDLYQQTWTDNNNNNNNSNANYVPSKPLPRDPFQAETGPILEQEPEVVNAATLMVEDSVPMTIGAQIDALDSSFFWYSAQVVSIELHNRRAIKVKYAGFEEERWQEWIPISQRYRIASHKSRSFGNGKLEGGIFALATTSYSMNIKNNQLLLKNGFSQLDYMAEHAILYSGYMQKRGGFNTSWKKRLFIIRNDGNMYYYPNESSQPKHFAISNITALKLIVGNRLQFDLLTNRRTYHLFCGSISDFMDWTTVILCLMSYLNDNTKNERRQSIRPSALNKQVSIKNVFGLFSPKSSN